jgi:hypothetical protein
VRSSISPWCLPKEISRSPQIVKYATVHDRPSGRVFVCLIHSRKYGMVLDKSFQKIYVCVCCMLDHGSFFISGLGKAGKSWRSKVSFCLRINCIAKTVNGAWEDFLFFSLFIYLPLSIGVLPSGAFIIQIPPEKGHPFKKRF